MNVTTNPKPKKSLWDIRTDGTSYKRVLAAAIAFMGLGHILYLKEWLKGILFATAEGVMLAFLPKIIRRVIGMFTLGSPKSDLPIMQRDNSIFMLIDGIIITVIIMLFITLYILSVKSALSSYKDYCRDKSFKSTGKSLREITDKAFPIAGLAPALIMIMFFVVVPLVFSSAVAFTNYSAPSHIPPNNTVDWVGLDNFKALLGGEALWTGAMGRVALWTFVWAALATLTCYFGGLIMAVILKESKLRIAPVFRGIFILPYAVPSVLTMLIWKNLLNGSFGTVNRTLAALGLINTAIPWLSNEWMAKFTCVLINLWAGFPYFMLLSMGSMTAISEDVQEAAVIDGASNLQKFRKLTLPMVLFQTMPLIIMSFTYNINNFGAIFFLTGGGPNVADSTTTTAGGTDILVTWIYDLTINLLRYNYAAVIGVMIFLALAPFAIWNFRRTKAFKEGEL